ncbi:binding-protein-dependent transport systems inner membrane component [Hymenobacter roseosalivarius DSM 11622]|uniref:Binding-protein-dependent transport systems inner membrane component n=1 Tax=Hymenobacter roseosalivarius DSM 11622 TaxID=645990 RepID=A0A1W1VIJ2_9BACT|nr:ABC transporter permease [Hymenobacter roseosalivarius]SMB93187.1 binding-protein-dependent transport systems inner membrane component [Hymenobacter roseosalivarius DSM 11622]
MATAAPVLTPAAPSVPPARPPGYYVRQRLWRNGPAMFGLGFILICTLIALAGYWVLPDNSPNANNGLVQLQKEPPGFSATVLRRPLPEAAQSTDSDNIFRTWLRGRAPRFQEVPIGGYEVVGDSILIQPYRNHSALADLPTRYSLAELGGKNAPQAELRNVVENERIIPRTYWLGTDKSGRDMLSRLLLGTRISLGIGLVAVLISLTLGMLIGAVAGYVGGWVDSVLMGLMTVVWSIPGIMLVIAISLALDSKGVWTSFVAVGLTMWVDVARVVRGQMLSLREKTFVEAGRVLGLPQSRLIARHLLPNMTGPLIVIATSNFAAAILLEAGLSFLGLGVQPPAPSWGLMVNEGFQLLGTQAGLWLTLLPGLAISLLVLSFNLLGNGLRDAYDPKTPING